MKYVYRFARNDAEGRGDMKELLGGKGAGLAEMCRLGVPVPPGFTIVAPACVEYLEKGRQLRPELQREALENLAWLQETLGKSFSGDGPPLLLSVRSGARVSMPGMMDTILNLGLNDETVERLADQSGDRRFAFDSYRRFIQMYGSVVLGIGHADFERLLDEIRDREDVRVDSEISVRGLEQLIRHYKNLVREETGEAFPTDPHEQLWGAVRAVFDSWNNPRAKFYRKIHHIDDAWGTGVTVQSMVFGNLGEGSGTGVCFSRNPATGKPGPYGEYLENAQGEDVVAGIRTPHHIHDADEPKSMHRRWPELFAQLSETLDKLERHFHDMQDTEFTIEKGALYLLQTRTGKRTSKAGLRIAVDMCREGLITEQEALLKIDPGSMSQLLASEFDERAKREILDQGQLLAKGLNAGPGAATGRIALSAEDAVALREKGESAILVTEETSPEDIEGMHSSVGILTQRGGMTSHAAVVARGMGKPCVVGCGAMKVDRVARQVRFEDRELSEGDFISIDGSTGEVILGRIPTMDSPLIRQLKEGKEEGGTQGEQFALLKRWIDRHATMTVRANADAPADARMARLLGAKGIGLCRTEHMFFGEDRILYMRKMILARDDKTRQEALDKLLPFQRDDFFHLFKEMDGLPVIIRLLDPPLHEFLPHDPAQAETVAKEMGLAPDAVMARVKELAEANPMLGHRGCRLGISFPPIYQMQTRAIVEAAKQARDAGVDVQPEIMVPLVALAKELEAVRGFIDPIIAESGLEIPVGAMIEIPRAALTADEIAEEAEFFSFGTNDLTQCGMGLSRDDSGSFLPHYLERGILASDPFKSVDQKGIGKLVEIAVASGRKTNPQMKMGVCGEHGGDPQSIAFFYAAGLNYVSCSPYRVPIALLAAAQASLRAKQHG